MHTILQIFTFTDMKYLIDLLAIVFIVTGNLNAQTKLTVNGNAIGFDCEKIITVFELDTVTYRKIKIYNAEINNNCLELSVTCGACNANAELVTDNKLIENQTYKLNFLLRYDKDSTPCNTILKTKLYFDLLPYKNMKSGQFIFISLLGERFNLPYK